jgi:opacity protein-like surface antigen
MKTRLLVCVSLLALVSGAATAQDAGGYYASLKAVGALANYDVGMKGESTTLELVDSRAEIVGGPALAFGYRMKNWPVRLEGEWIWRYRYDMNAQTVEASPRGFKINHGTHSLGLNAYYDAQLTERWFTKGTAFGYVGGGLGVALNTAEGTADRAGLSYTVNNSEVDLTWMLTIGMRYHLSKRWIVDVAYRFSDLGGMDTGATPVGQAINTSNYFSHDLLIGLAYGF